MKNKGRKHKAGRTGELKGICDSKSMIVQLTRPIESMSSKGWAKGKFDKKKWHKRVRGYFKSQTKNPLSGTEE
jgi:hypothetical protein